MESKSVGIITPLALNSVPIEFHQSYIASVGYLQMNAHKLPFKLKELKKIAPATFPIDANRNECIEWIKEWNCDITIWLDADQDLTNYGTPEQEKDVLFRLLKDGYDYPVYAGIYYLKKAPFTPVLMQTNGDWNHRHAIVKFPKDKLFYADIIGMGCCKIDREVIDKLKRPYFKYTSIPSHCDDMGDLIKFKIEHDVHDVSEDVHFWKQVKDAGYRIVIDPQIQVGHVTSNVVTPGVFESYFALQMEALKKQKGAEFDEWYSTLCDAELV